MWVWLGHRAEGSDRGLGACEANELEELAVIQYISPDVPKDADNLPTNTSRPEMKGIVSRGLFVVGCLDWKCGWGHERGKRGMRQANELEELVVIQHISPDVQKEMCVCVYVCVCVCLCFCLCVCVC